MSKSQQIKATAIKLLKRGYSVIPVSPFSKNPTIKDWKPYQINPMTEQEAEKFFDGQEGIAILTGGSQRVMILDADMKYDLSGDLWERFMAKIPLQLKTKLKIHATKNKGYHILFKCPTEIVEPNKKLASRYTTAYERHQSYMAAFENPEFRDQSSSIGHNDKIRVLFETRGGSKKTCGGYALIPPTEGYTAIQNKDVGIPELSKNEVRTLFEIAGSFNEVRKTTNPKRYRIKPEDWKVSPLDDFNDKCDFIDLMGRNGWMVVSETSTQISTRLKRPGAASRDSAEWLGDKRKFVCYSTSTVFDPNILYSPLDVMLILECENDFLVAYKYLIDNGYGVK